MNWYKVARKFEYILTTDSNWDTKGIVKNPEGEIIDTLDEKKYKKLIKNKKIKNEQDVEGLKEIYIHSYESPIIHKEDQLILKQLP